MAESIVTIISDTQSQVVATAWVVINTPRRDRKRFPENCVTLCEDEADARRQADPAAGTYAAIASGPSRSSEGVRLFYLIRWAD